MSNMSEVSQHSSSRAIQRLSKLFPYFVYSRPCKCISETVEIYILITETLKGHVMILDQGSWSCWQMLSSYYISNSSSGGDVMQCSDYWEVTALQCKMKLAFLLLFFFFFFLFFLKLHHKENIRPYCMHAGSWMFLNTEIECEII